jgi:hypothetical protein
MRASLPALFIASGAVALMLVDCGGGSHAAPALPPSAATPAAVVSPGRTAATATLTVTVTVPNQVATTDAKTRRLRYISPGTLSISVSAAPAGQLGNTAATVLTIADISSKSAACASIVNGSTTPNNYGRSCTVSVPIPLAFTTTSAGTPSVDFDVATFNVAAASVVNTNAAVSVAAQNASALLSEGTLINQSVLKNSANLSIPIVLSGSVATVAIRSVDATNSLYFHAIPYQGNTASLVSVPVAVTAKDASGSTIIGTYLQPISASLGGANQNLGLTITNGVATPANGSSPAATPTAMPTALATTIASSADQFSIVATGEGVLYAPLTITLPGGAVVQAAVRPDNPGVYNEYDQYDQYDNTLLQNGAPWGVSPQALAADTSGNLYYAFTYNGVAGYFGSLTFTPGSPPTPRSCAIANAAPPFGAMMPQVLGGYAYFVDANGALFREPTSLATANNSDCPNGSALATLPFGSGSTEQAVSMTLAYDGSNPEVWIATNAGYLYAWIPSTNAFRVFGNNDSSLHPWINVKGTASSGFLIATPTITALAAFDKMANSAYLPSYYFGAQNGFANESITQGIIFGDAANGGLDIVFTQPTPSPVTSPTPPPLFAEGTPGPQHFSSSTVAFIGPSGYTLTASTNGSLNLISAASGLIPELAMSQANDAWYYSQTLYAVANGSFGPSAITPTVPGLAAEGGAAFWGVGQGSLPRGLIRYTYPGYLSTVFPNIPNGNISGMTVSAALVGGDGRIWFADSSNSSLYAFPGYGLTTGNPYGSFVSGLGGESKRRRPATKH